MDYFLLTKPYLALNMTSEILLGWVHSIHTFLAGLVWAAISTLGLHTVHVIGQGSFPHQFSIAAI